GCGYVADYYVTTLANHPELELVGVADRDPERADRFARHHKLHRFRDYGELLADDRVQLVVNLTNPRAHAEVSRAAIEAGKHVFSEKPLATEWAEAVELVDRAEAAGVRIASAPSTMLGEAAQTLWKLVRDG